MTTTIPLPDGRKLGFAEYGRPKGSPVLFCHGTPGSRLTITEEMSRLADAMDIWLIVPDRPGYGESDPKPNRRFIDWPEDVSVLLKKLKINRFRALGYSMGSPYALACAYMMPESVSGVSLVGGIAPNLFDPEVIATISPTSNALFTMARDNPSLLIETLKTLAPDGDSLLAAMAGGFPATDKVLLAQAQITSTFLRDSIETLRQGHDEAATDFVLTANSWGFDLKAIQAPTHIWNGMEDLNVPPAMARHLASNLPRNKIRLLPGEGHLCLFTHWEEILGDIS